MIDASMAKLASFERVHGYVNHASAEIQKWLTPVRHLPSFAGADHEEPSRSALGLPPVFPPIGTADTPTRFGAPFVYPSAEKKRRLREKNVELGFPRLQHCRDLHASMPGGSQPGRKPSA